MPQVTRNEPAQVYRATDSAARVSTTTVADDTDLSIAADINATYLLRVSADWTNAGGGEFKWGLKGAVGVTAFHPTLGDTGQDIGGGTSIQNVSAAAGYIDTTWKIKTGPTAGNLVFQWAQKTSDVGATILKAGSHMSLEKVSN